jgi:hypothetical protein
MSRMSRMSPSLCVSGKTRASALFAFAGVAAFAAALQDAAPACVTQA